MKRVRILILLFLIIVGTATALNISFWLSEHYFFDKLYYQKSTQFGYWIKGKSLSFRDFGKRSEDMRNLFSEIATKNVMGGSVNNRIFTIVMIGDSFVWGTGIKETDRFVNILENKLNTLLPTKIISLGNVGDNMLDNYLKYYFYTKNHTANLYIFGMVDNDLFLRGNNVYSREVQDNLIKFCEKPIVYDPENTLLDTDYTAYIYDSYDEKNGNICIFRNVLDSIPKNKNILFLNFGDNFGFSELLKKYTKEVESRGFTVLSVPYTKDDATLHVSSIEYHPSAKANRLFVDLLYTYVTESWLPTTTVR